MKCPSHPDNDVIGYCIVCGQLGCNQCLAIFEGDLYCRKDFKAIAKRTGREFKPVAETEQEKKRREKALHRPARQRLVIHRKTGDTCCGVCFSMNLESTGFYADLCDRTGKPLDQHIFVPFEELKAVYYVKSFDGRFDRNLRYREWHPEGSEVVVEFKDGEILEGNLLRPYRPDAPRFFLIPKDPQSNNISVLTEASAVERVCTPAEYEQSLMADLDAYVEKHAGRGISIPEAEGDFYFRGRDYFRASQAYEKALADTPDSPGLLKKYAITQYNIGARHIHRHEYEMALEYVRKAHELAPDNTRIHVKLQELRRIVVKREEKREKLLDRKLDGH